MAFSKILARKFFFPSILALNGEKILREFSKHSILNIMYHGVVDKDSNFFSPRHIQKDIFERQMKYISRNFNVISVPEAFNLYRNKIFPDRKTITVSFDDGYLNNLKTALPIIEKYQIKTTFFISGFCLEERNFPLLWPDIIAFLNYFYKNKKIKITDWEFVNLTEVHSGENLINIIKRSKAADRDKLLENIYSQFDIQNKLHSVEREIWELIKKDDLVKMVASPYVEIGSHGYLHYNYNHIDLSDTAEDMLKSKKIIENIIQKEINMLAYPDGGYTEEVKKTASDIGFVNQLAVNYMLPTDRNDLNILNRHGVSASTSYESGIFFINKAFSDKGYN